MGIKNFLIGQKQKMSNGKTLLIEFEMKYVKIRWAKGIV